MMSEEGIVDEEEVKKTEQDLEKKITVADVNYITMDSETYIYIRDQEGILYKQKVSSDETVMFIQKGDVIDVSYEENSNHIYDLISWKK